MKILIIKLRYIGDTLTLLPLVKAIKKNQPEAKVFLLVYKGTEGILRYQKEIDGILLLDRKEIKESHLFKKIIYGLKTWISTYKNRFDVVIDLTSSDRSAFISLMSGAKIRIGAPLGNFLERIAYHNLIEGDTKSTHVIDYQMYSLKFLGFSIPEPDTTIFVPEEINEKLMTKWSGLINTRPLVVIHPGARKRHRQWREERFAYIADRIKTAYNSQIVLIGGPGEEGILEKVEANMVFKPEAKFNSLELIEVAALLKHAQLFIGNDTATGHIAAGVGTPHIILFGPTFPQLWAPKGGKGIYIFKSPECCGCPQISCFKKDNPCMDWIKVEDVWQAVEKML